MCKAAIACDFEYCIRSEPIRQIDKQGKTEADDKNEMKLSNVGLFLREFYGYIDETPLRQVYTSEENYKHYSAVSVDKY